MVPLGRVLSVGRPTLLNAIMQVAARVNSRGFARWTFHFLSGERNLRRCGEQVVDELAFLPDFRVSKAGKTIPTVYNPPWIWLSCHDEHPE
jgi:hypothetical protein